MKLYDARTPLAELLDACAAKQATPGGGSVTALVGALAASMGEMVVNYSVGKKSLAAHEPKLRAALDELTRARRLLIGLMLEDQQAYDALTAARKLPSDAPGRDDAIGPALLASIRVPQAMAAASVGVLDVSSRLVPIVNFHLLSDLAVCADLAMATVRCATYNVRVNLADASETERNEAMALASQMLSHGAVLIQQISPHIWARHASGE